MRKLVGLYIEDEIKNVELMIARFSFYPEIELMGLDEYPQSPAEFYEFVLENSIDFLLVDHELEKASVDYKGIDVLREIRKHERNIYAVLITNYLLDDYKDELKEYDFQLNKKDLAENGKMKELVAKIERACGLRRDNNVLDAMDQKNDRLDALLENLKKTFNKD